MPELRPFQRADIDALKKAKLKALVASSPGTGKTAVAIRALAELHESSLPAAVVCPASVLFHWKREFRTWAPGVPVRVIETSKDKLPKGNGVFILSWAMLSKFVDALIYRGVRTIVADECHFSKNEEAIRSQSLDRLAQTCSGVLLLSGTPIVNSKQELAVLKHLLYQDEEPLMIRRLIEDVAPDIPPKQRSSVYVKLREKHQENYDRADQQFEEWLRTEKEKLYGEGRADFEVERILAAEALAKIGYLRRLAGEYKVPAAADWISRAVRIGEPVVVFMEHQAVLQKLRKALRRQRIRVGVIEGATTPKVRQELIDAFQKNEFPVLLCTKAGKEGITLTAARNLLFVERFFTSADEEQAEDRIRRIGQKWSTTMWYLHAIGTVDDRIDQIVRQKRSIIHEAIGSALVPESNEDVVASILATWDNHVAVNAVPENLGLGDALDPLPSPREAHAVVFSDARWDARPSIAWCKMNGYTPRKRVELKEQTKYVVHPVDVFVPGTFEVTRVSRDIKIITGRRMTKDNERKVRAAARSVHR